MMFQQKRSSGSIAGDILDKVTGMSSGMEEASGWDGVESEDADTPVDELDGSLLSDDES